MILFLSNLIFQESTCQANCTAAFDCWVLIPLSPVDAWVLVSWFCILLVIVFLPTQFFLPPFLCNIQILVVWKGDLVHCALHQQQTVFHSTPFFWPPYLFSFLIVWAIYIYFQQVTQMFLKLLHADFLYTPQII